MHFIFLRRLIKTIIADFKGLVNICILVYQYSMSFTRRRDIMKN